MSEVLNINDLGSIKEAKYKVWLKSLRETCSDPQVWEAECLDGMILYIRFVNGTLTCKEKWNGQYICSGNPMLDRERIPIEKVDFYLEMYSHHEIQFI